MIVAQKSYKFLIVGCNYIKVNTHDSDGMHIQNLKIP